MNPPGPKRTSFSRVCRTLLALFFACGQGVLIAHHHARARIATRASLNHNDVRGVDVDCRVCGLAAHSQAVCAATAASAFVRLDGQSLPDVVLPVTRQTHRLRASSRAPPVA